MCSRCVGHVVCDHSKFWCRVTESQAQRTVDFREKYSYRSTKYTVRYTLGTKYEFTICSIDVYVIESERKTDNACKTRPMNYRHAPAPRVDNGHGTTTSYQRSTTRGTLPHIQGISVVNALPSVLSNPSPSTQLMRNRRGALSYPARPPGMPAIRAGITQRRKVRGRT